jgi:preprotein translocase subunit SecE
MVIGGVLLAEKKAVQKAPNKVRVFINETIGELRKVNWPTRQEAINLTTIVLIVIAAMAAFLGLLDLAFAELFRLILS